VYLFFAGLAVLFFDNFDLNPNLAQKVYKKPPDTYFKDKNSSFGV
jgi:hypothetical protein